MTILRAVTVATTLALGTAGSAFALSATLSDTLTISGDTLAYNFSGLPASDGTGGTLTIATGASGGVPGIDLDDEMEFFDVFIEGTDLGRFECGANDGGMAIPGSSGGIDCIFSFDLSLTPALLDTVLADASVEVLLEMGDMVDTFGENDTVDVTLSYSEATAATVPLPATVPLLIVALGGLFGLRRR